MSRSVETITSTVGETETEIIRINVSDYEALSIEVAITGQALDTFQILGRYGQSATEHTLFSTAAHYTTPSGALFGASGDLTTIAAGADGWFNLITIYLTEVIVKIASGNVAGSGYTVNGERYSRQVK